MLPDPREPTTPEQPGELPGLPDDPSNPAGPNDIPNDNPDDERRYKDGPEGDTNRDDQAAAVAEIVGIGV